MNVLLCLSLALVDLIAGYPYRGYHYAPQRTVMFGGYYGQPAEGRSYIPQGSVTLVAGDTIATNSFAGRKSPFQDEEQFATSIEETSERHQEEEEPPIAEEDVRFTKTSKSPKRRPQKPQPSEADEDDDQLPSSWPFQGGRNGVPSYNAFFPITFGSSGSRTRSGEDGFYPGSATAIANSFSTGKGGVATSHATSFGDPYLSTMLRNGNAHGQKGKKSPLDE